LPEWWLQYPADAEAVVAFAAGPTPRTVAWLDELQRYLSHPVGLPAGVVRNLIATRMVLVAMLWPDEYGMRVAPPVPGQPDPYANDRQLLGMAQIIDVPDAFSAAERRSAETFASDRRIRIALDSPDAGFTQILAAGPELVRWWKRPPPTSATAKRSSPLPSMPAAWAPRPR
jgi:hypothetical protein